MNERSSLLMGEDGRIQAMRDGNDVSKMDRWMSKGNPTAPYAIFTLAPHYRIFLFSENIIQLPGGKYTARVECHCEGVIEDAEITGDRPDIIKYKAWRDAIVKLIPEGHLDHIYQREQKGGG